MGARSMGTWWINAAVAAAFLLAMALSPQGAEASAGQPSYRAADAAPQAASDWRYCNHRTSQPELGVFYPGQPVKVTIVAAYAGWTSDLSLVDELGNAVPIQPDAKDHLNSQLRPHDPYGVRGSHAKAARCHLAPGSCQASAADATMIASSAWRNSRAGFGGAG